MKKLAIYSISVVFIFSVCVRAEEIQPGEYKTGYIGVDQNDTYTFYANAGDVVTILMGEAGGGFTPQVELHEPDGSWTSRSGYSSATLQAITIEQSGTCVIIARDKNGDSTGTYGLSMIKNPGTVLNDPEDDPVPILPGEYKSGYIAEGDLDGYTFYANAGDVVTILMGEVNDYGGFRPQVELHEPDGSWTSQSGYSSATLQALTIEQSGTCTIIARDHNGDANGTYGLSMIKNPGTELNDPEDDPVPILPGEYKSGYIAEGDLDGYTFDANAGDVVTILMGEADGGAFFNPRVELHEPNGNWTSDWGNESATLNALTIGQSGTCIIIARASNGSSTGTYGLSMIKNPGTELNDPEDDPVPILPGEYKSGYIAEGDLDGYTFYANAGDVVTILVGEAGGGFTPQVELHEPDGSWISQAGYASATLQAITIEQSGTCVIIARDNNGDSTGTYGLSMIKIPGTGLNDPEDDPVPILPGEYKSGYIAEGDLDGYTFDANAGDVVTILMGEVNYNGDFHPQVELHEPDGSWTSQWGYSSATLNALTIKQSGTCTIIARERDGDANDTYGLSMIKNPGTELNDPEDDPVPILPGEYKSGYIAEGDLDGYTFYANAGDVVTILMGEFVHDYAVFEPQVELIEPDGNRTSQWGNESATLNALTIEQSGTCIIIARAHDGSDTSTYGLSMIKNPCTELNDPEDDPVPILPGEYKNGYIAKGDLDGYTFYANAGDVVSILIEEVNDYGGFNPQVELHEPDGSWTSQAGYFSAILEALTIEQSGNCVIIARDNDGDANGTYGLSMSRINVAGTPTISSLSDFPDPVIQQSTLTLTASGVSDSNGWIVQVDFYRDLNRNGYLDLCGGDQLLGSDTNDVNGWSWSGSIGCLPPVGQNMYFARAQDNDGLWSDPNSSTGEILRLYNGDFDINCKVDFLDFAVLGAYWLDDTCGEPDWCDGTDIDKIGIVEWIDLGRFTEDWLEGVGP